MLCMIPTCMISLSSRFSYIRYLNKLFFVTDGDVSRLRSPLTVIVLQEGAVIEEVEIQEGTVLEEGTVEDDVLVENETDNEMNDIEIIKECSVVKEEVIEESGILCGKCGADFPDEARLDKHRENCVDVKYYCLMCKGQFDSENGLRVHSRLHSRVASICEKCGRNFRFPENLLVHQREECGKEATLSCVLCEEKFHYKAQLNAHLIENHSDGKGGEPPQMTSVEERYHCRMCPRSFTRVGSLNYHVSRKHSGSAKVRGPEEFPHLCRDCGNRYKSGTQLCRHRRWECGKEPMFKCELCVKKFHHRHGLKQHIRLHLAKRDGTDKTPQYCCEKCGRDYKLKSSLNNHIKWECGKEPGFACDACNIKFSHKGNLKKHMLAKHVENIETLYM